MRTAWEEHSDGQRRAVVELTASEAAASADALSFYVRRRFGASELALSDKALSLRAVTGMSDGLGSMAAAGLGGRLVLSEPDLRALREALCLYVAERDTESYQPPEERARLAALRALTEPLGDLLARLPSALARGALVLH